MALRHIEVEGFKSIRSLSFNLRPLNILIGSNGSGKSNFISLFKLLNQAVEQRFQLSVRQAGGANALLHYGRRYTSQIRVLLMFEQNGYECVWAPTNDDSLIFTEETGYFQGPGYARPYSDSYPVTLQESVLPKMAEE